MIYVVEIIKVNPINTRYSVGEEIYLPHNDSIWDDLSSYERDEWGKNILRQNNITIRELVYVGRRFNGNVCIGLTIVNQDWKTEVMKW